MQYEDKIYGLIAQAEDIQKHAVKLQNGAEKAFVDLPLAVEQAGKKIRSTGLLGALFVLAVALVVIGAVYFAGSLLYKSRLEELAELKMQIAQARGTLDEMQSKTWRLELVKYSDGSRGIILPKGVQANNPVRLDDGRIAVVIRP